MNIVFAKTRYHYDSYIDFWRLVAAAGFATVFVDEIDITADATYIFSPYNGELEPLVAKWRNGAQRRARVVWWNLERPEDNTLDATVSTVKDNLDAVWVSDRTYATKRKMFTYVPVAGHKDFGARVIEKRYDVCALAYLWGRRLEAVNSLRENGIKVAPEAWGRAAQDETVAKSHLMLNLHQYEDMYVVAPIRFAAAASYAIPVVSETYADRAWDPLVLGCGSLPAVMRAVPELLRDPDRLRCAGAKLFEALCVQTDFGREVVRAVEALA